jgi:hypothetical protein
MATSVNVIKKVPFEKSLDAYITQRGIDKKLVSTYAKSIAALQKSGFQIIDILDFGQPVPDWILVKTRISAGSIGLLAEVFKVPKWKGVDIFPEGTVNPELVVNIKMGNFRG